MGSTSCAAAGLGEVLNHTGAEARWGLSPGLPHISESTSWPGSRKKPWLRDQFGKHRHWQASPAPCACSLHCLALEGHRHVRVSCACASGAAHRPLWDAEGGINSKMG